MTGDRECRKCGARTPRPEAVYCSRACYYDSRCHLNWVPDDVNPDGADPGTHPPCAWCGGPVVQRPNERVRDWRTRRTCGRECATAASRTRVPTTGTPPEPGWETRAVCTQPGQDPEHWFPGDRDYQGIRDAKALCGSCPVRTECLAAALTVPEEYGVWGGLTPEERRALARAAYRAKWHAEVKASEGAAGVGT